MFSQRSVCLSVCKISKSYEQFLVIFLGVVYDLSNSRLDFGGIPDLTPVFCSNFSPTL